MQNYNLKTVKSGNTFQGVRFKMPENPVYSLVGATVIMQVRKTPANRVVATLSTEPGNENIVIEPDYVYKIIPHVVNIPGDLYAYDIKILFADGREQTYVGGTWEIEKVVTLTNN